MARARTYSKPYLGCYPDHMPIKVLAFWDEEAHVWVAESADVPGLITEAATLEALSAKLEVMIPELFEANGSSLPVNLPIHLEARRELHSVV